MLGQCLPAPCACSSRVSSRTKNGLPPLRCHNCSADLRRGRDPGQRVDHRVDVQPGRGRAAGRAARRRRAASSCGRLVVPVGADEQHPADRQRPRAGTTAASATARRPTAGRRAPRPRAGRRQARRGSGRRRRRAGTGRRRLPTAPSGRRAGCIGQPAAAGRAERRPVTGRPVARSTWVHGQYGGAPLPSQQNPRRTVAVRAGLARPARPAPRTSRCRPRR